MAGSIADLATVANQTKDAFNSGAKATVLDRLADNLVVKSLGPRPHNLTGVVGTFTATTSPTAKQIIINQMPQANFDETEVPTFAPPIGSMADQAIMTGDANWTDERGTDHIKFVFRCVFDPERGWLFQDVSAKAG